MIRKVILLVYFSDPVELAELRIYGMQEDGSGDLWLSSDRGLSRYDPESGILHPVWLLRWIAKL